MVWGRKGIMNSKNQKKYASKTNKGKNLSQTQLFKWKKENNKVTSYEQAEFADMNQIEWFPIDPYCDWKVKYLNWYSSG